jgi:hypothetical protein
MVVIVLAMTTRPAIHMAPKGDPLGYFVRSSEKL